jgi:thiol-disulfide isomerase/thioredoxin
MRRPYGMTVAYDRDMNADALRTHFDKALNYADYLATGTPEQQRRWTQVYDATHVTDAERALLHGFVRNMNVLVISGIWCGDCVQQVPLMQRLVELSDKVDLRIVDRDVHKDLSKQFRINGGERVPVVLLLSEDHELCAVAGDRSLSRYRAIAARQLGASCPIGLEAPDKDELSVTLKDWAAELERVHLMLRLSSRLRQKHGD